MPPPRYFIITTCQQAMMLAILIEVQRALGNAQ
jgi:hypothetical protein